MNHGESKEEKQILARLNDAMRLAEKRGAPICTDFLTPAQQITAKTVAAQAPNGIRFSLWGGYETAERKRGVFYPARIDAPDFSLAVAALETKGDRPAHSEILGALIGSGVRREKIGDILVSLDPPRLICDAAILPFLTENFTRAGRAAFRTVESELPENGVPEPPSEEKTFTVPSLRLDCVAAEGFGLSRTKTAEAIRAGAACVNWKEALSPSAEVSEGDMITLRGSGRLQIVSVGGISRKNRIYVTVKRFKKR